MVAPVGIKPFTLYMVTGAVAYYYNSFEFILYATSFVQYMTYLNIYWERSSENYEEFKRDALHYKVVSNAFLYYCFFSSTIYVWLSDPDYICLALMIVGYIISIGSYFVLGNDGTYYSIELGLLKPEWKFGWPYGNYGIIPAVWHPMYMGQVYALFGMYKVESFRITWPYLAPLHILCYAVCIAQEYWDIHKGNWGSWGLKMSGKTKLSYE